MRVSIIVAVAENGVIGSDGKLPWHIPRDLAHFKRVTMGKPIIMGRKTYQSIGRALPGRLNIVLSRSSDFAAAGVTRVGTLDAGLRIARESGAAEAMIIGGGQVYELAWPHAARIYLTKVHAAVAGDTVFPSTRLTGWRQVAREDLAASESAPAVSFITLDKAPEPETRGSAG